MEKREIRGIKVMVPTPLEWERFSLQKVGERTAREALLYTRGNVSNAARLLGVNRRTFQRNYDEVIKAVRGELDSRKREEERDFQRFSAV